MNKTSLVLGVLLLLASGIIIYQNFLSDNLSTHSHGADASAEKQLYTCGMHPDIISDEPGNCPICEMKLTPLKSKKSGEKKERTVLYWVAPMDPNERYDSPGKSAMGMDLVPVYEDEVAGGGIVEIDPVTAQNMNVKIAEVESGILSKQITTNGLLKTDETREYHVNARTDGWVEKLYVNYTGQKIKKGDKLLEIYSPKLISAQKEYLAALKYRDKLSSSSIKNVASGGEALIAAAYEKLVFFGMSYPEIFELENNGTVKEFVSIVSPIDGTVLNKNVVEGQKIKPGEQLFHIANLNKIWVIADIYENEINSLAIGDNAVITIPGYYGEQFPGKITFIYPTVDNKTHTVKVRIELSNISDKLKPGMVADVAIKGESSNSGPIIPESAVIRSGKNNVAIVALGEGKFKPVNVTLGLYADSKFRVTDGLAPGMKVVTSAQFLIDSESNLKEALDDFSKGSPPAKTNNAHSEEKPAIMSEHDHTSESNDHSGVDNEYGIESPLIRTGIIDVKSIDSNRDGKLFECPMDWNIISDEPGRCPSCEMKLKEYSIDEIKDNLTEHGYEYKK